VVIGGMRSRLVWGVLALAVWPAGGSTRQAVAQEKTMAIRDVSQILATSQDRKLLAGAAAQLAASAERADHELLLRWLPTEGFLARVQAPDEYNGPRQALRLRRVTTALRDNRSPVARESILRLVASETFTAIGARVELLLEATVAVRPAPGELVAFWNRYSQPEDGFTPITIMVLVENGSPPALALLERKLADPAHDDADKIAWMRADVLTHRNAPRLLETCERLLASGLPAPLKSALIDVLFDYRPGEWFRPGSSYSPPPERLYSAEARELVERIARQALAGLDLNDRQRTAIRAMVETLRTR
jgi:hypothetical protein